MLEARKYQRSAGFSFLPKVIPEFRCRCLAKRPNSAECSRNYSAKPITLTLRVGESEKPVNCREEVTMNGFSDRLTFSSHNSTSETNDKEATGWKDLGTSMNAISFGFVATAILVSMFLFMAIFEYLLGPRTSLPITQAQGQLQMLQQQSQVHSNQKKIKHPEYVSTSNSINLSVLMPGQEYPTYLAQAAPLSCPREGVYWTSHDYCAFASL